MMKEQKSPEKPKKSSEKPNKILGKLPKKTEINKWRIAFLVLLGLVLGTFLFLGTRIFQNREADYMESLPIVEQEGEPILTINTNKTKVNQLIDFYLQDFQEGTDVQYRFYLENEALLNGEFEVLGVPIQFYLYFDPYVMENGNVQLKAKSLSIGTLGLPINEIMKHVQRNFKLPDWVEVNPDDQTILIRLDQFRMQNGMFVKADKINLVDDDIRFSLYLPKTDTTTDSTATSESSKEED